MNKEVLKAKEQAVFQIVADTKNANTVIVCEYRGLTVADITALRRELLSVEAHLYVFKNSLMERAVDGLGYADLNQYLSGPNAYVFSKDTIAGAKVINKFARRNPKLIVKGGIVEGKVVDAAQMKVVSTLPGREGLISMFLSCVQAPIRQFACAVKAVAEKN